SCLKATTPATLPSPISFLIAKSVFPLYFENFLSSANTSGNVSLSVPVTLFPFPSILLIFIFLGETFFFDDFLGEILFFFFLELFLGEIVILFFLDFLA